MSHNRNQLPATNLAPTPDTLRGWKFEDANLVAGPLAEHGHNQQASTLLNQEGPLPNSDMTHFIGLALNKQWDVQLEALPEKQAAITRTEAVLANDKIHQSMRDQLENILEIQQKDAALSADVNNQTVRSGIYREVRTEVGEQEKQAIETEVKARIDADKLPWTAPNIRLPEGVMEAIKDIHRGLVEPPEALPSDKFKVALPMKHFEGPGGYSPQDVALLEQAGVNPASSLFTREELKHANVFFLNRVGGGEQPIFGLPIPDPNKPGEFFNVQDRCFLTREEFQMVYDYQQANDYSLEPGQDAADVQMDMIMFAVLPDVRSDNDKRNNYDMRKGYGSAGRENKYGQVRSPFIDSGFLVENGIETSILGYGRRMNTTTIHLTNGHPEYPGVSEMCDPNNVAHDQRYLTVAEFTEKFYVPLTTEEDAFNSLRNNLPTKREQAWTDRNTAR